MICLCCTGSLLIESFVDYFKIKPTVSSFHKVRLSEISFPDVLVCYENGFDEKKMNLYGYKASGYYYRGWDNQNNLIGWSGINEQDSSITFKKSV